MEVTALCIRLLMNSLWLLVVQVQQKFYAQKAAGSVILESPVLPLMEGDTVTLRCRNKTTPFKVAADFYKNGVFIRSSDTGNVTIHNVSKSDEGFYKCNISGAGESTEHWLTLKGGAVILELPVYPVTEGHSVTLRCRKNKAPTHHIADFYKSGFHIGTGYRGDLTIGSVSRFDEGPYKCSISGAGESADSWLSVKVIPVALEGPLFPVMEGDAVTLHCLNKMTTSITADFYKDGLFIGNGSEGNMTIHRISKSDEGLYKCNIFGAGESLESWLAVKECPKVNTTFCYDQLPVLLYLLIRTVGTISWVALLLFVLRKRHSRNH